MGKGERFCFLVTFIWALGDVGVRALHKSGVPVCECRHCDINPGARRLPSGYLLLLLLRPFFVAPVSFPSRSLSFHLPRVFPHACFSSLSLYLLLLPHQVPSPPPRLHRGTLEHSMVHPVLHIMYPTTVSPAPLSPPLDWTRSTPPTHARPPIGATLMTHERIITEPTSTTVSSLGSRRNTAASYSGGLV